MKNRELSSVKAISYLVPLIIRTFPVLTLCYVFLSVALSAQAGLTVYVNQFFYDSLTAFVVEKASINNALRVAHAEAPAPAAYADDYEELKKAFELAHRSEESTKLIKEIDKALDEKARERYASLTDDEIMELLVNKKWYYAIGKGIIDLYTAISHKLAERITELSKRYELTLTDLDSQINEAESSLSDMLGELTGNDYDMKAFAELIELLGGSNDVE